MVMSNLSKQMSNNLSSGRFQRRHLTINFNLLSVRSSSDYYNSIRVPSPLTIVNYVSTLLPNAAGAKHLALSIIRNFLSYLVGLGNTGKDLSFLVPRDNYKSKQSFHPFIQGMR